MPKVTFYPSNQFIELKNENFLLELENQAQNELPFGCCSGICGTCAFKVISGMENLSPRNEKEQDLLDSFYDDFDDKRLGCQCKIHGDICIEPLNN